MSLRGSWRTGNAPGAATRSRPDTLDACLPNDVERAERVFAKMREQANDEVAWVNRAADYGRFLDVLTAPSPPPAWSTQVRRSGCCWIG